MLSKATEIAKIEHQSKLDVISEDADKELKFGLVEVVYEWANGMVSFYNSQFCTYIHQLTNQDSVAKT